MKILSSIERLKSGLRIFLTALIMTLALVGCPSDTYSDSDSDSDSGGSGSNGCQAGYCNSNGVCCPSNARYECQGSCYVSSQAANAAHPGQCNNFNTVC